MRFYTNVQLRGNKILLRGIENGRRVQLEKNYSPYLFVPSKAPDSKYKTIKGNPVDKLEFESPKEAREWMKQWEGVQNFDFYGFTNYTYTFINDEYNGPIDYDPALIEQVGLDIEVNNQGQAIADTIRLANKETTAISLYHNGTIYGFGTKDFNKKSFFESMTDKDRALVKNIRFYKARDEADLLLKFIDLWETIKPDIITGWNIEGFDIPFLINRISNLLGKDYAKRLSPWKILEERTFINNHGEEQISYTPLGVSVLDYLQLYKKFTYTEQESYKLDFICHVELDLKKLDYSAYESLYELYDKNPQLFFEYNMIDTVRVMQLDNKLGLINQIIAIAYDAHVNFNDGFTSVKLWDVIIHNYLLAKNIVVPQFKPSSKTEQIAGAYVKEPIPGMYKWVVSFDLNSLYPHLIMQYNISPEMLASDLGKLPFDVDQILHGKLNSEDIRSYIQTNDVAVAGTGWTFRKHQRGFLPELMEAMYNDRTVFKRKMLDAEQEYENTKNSDLVRIISINNNMQMAKKIQLNSAYGALSNQYFRWYDDRLAESITLSGQVGIRWMENAMNEYLNKNLGTEGFDYIIASDTDSIYVNLDKLVEMKYKGKDASTEEVTAFLDETASKILEPFIDKTYGNLAKYVNAYAQKMKMKRESICDKAIWTGKKHYILNVLNSEGVQYAEPKIKMKGIAAVKSTTPMVCREKLKQAFKLIMTGDESAVQKFVAGFKQEFMALPFEDIALPKGLKTFNKYNTDGSFYVDKTPFQARGAIVYNKLIRDKKLDIKYNKIVEGDKIKYCYLKKPNPVRENVISAPGTLPRQFGLDAYIDYETQFEKAFTTSLMDVMKVIGWTIEKQASLEDFW